MVAPEQHEIDVFLSYNSRDREAILLIAASLRAKGVTVFFDRWYLIPGLPWQSALEKALNQCRTIAIFIGAHGLSPWQQREKELALIRQARNPSLRVIPVLLPGSEPILDLNFLFLNTWVDLHEGFIGEGPSSRLATAILNLHDLKPDTNLREAWDQLCPYRGLRPFREEDAPFFFGRSVISDRLAAMARSHTLLGVVGASGSGKSSIVRAGLIPRLRRNTFGIIYDFLSLNPTNQPLLSLSACLVPLLEPEATEVLVFQEAAVLSNLLREGEVKLSQLVRRVLKKQPGTDRLLIFIDQWEELYTLCRSDRERSVFMEELLDATESSALTVVLTLRGDFYGHALENRALADRLQGGLINIGPMTKGELREVMVEPTQLIGLQFELGLVERILSDLGRGPGNLPLLEFVLTSLWEQRHQGYFRNSSYETIGQAQGAISRWADSVLEQVPPEQLYLTRQLLTQLVQLGESTEDTRRRVSLNEIPVGSTSVVRLLINNRLLVTNLDQGTGVDTIELAHDTLIETWETLKAWVAEDRETLLKRKHLSEARGEWERADHDPLALLAGVRLLETESFLHDQSISLPAIDQEFLQKSILRRQRQSLLKRAALAILIFSLMLALSIAYVAYGERRRAETEAASEKQVANFLIGLFESVDPAQSKGRTLTAREVVDNGAKELDKNLNQKPATKATLLNSLGRVYRNLGLYDSAIAMTNKALAIRREAFGNEHPAVAESLHNLALLIDAKGKYAEAEALYRQSLAMRIKLLGDSSPVAVETLANLSDCLAEEAKYGEAQSLARRALSLQLKYHPNDRAASASIMNSLGRMLGPKWPESENLLREALAIRVQLFGFDNPEVVASINNLAVLLRAKGDYRAAEPLLRQALEINRRLLGPEHPVLALSLNNLGNILEVQGKYNEAEALYHEALAMKLRIRDDELSIAATLNNLAILYHHTKRYAEGEAMSKDALASRRKILGDHHPLVAQSFATLGMLQTDTGEYDRAEFNLRKALEMERGLYGEEDLRVSSDLGNLGILLAEKGDTRSAISLVNEALDIRTKLGVDDLETKHLRSFLTNINSSKHKL